MDGWMDGPTNQRLESHARDSKVPRRNFPTSTNGCWQVLRPKSSLSKFKLGQLPEKRLKLVCSQMFAVNSYLIRTISFSSVCNLRTPQQMAMPVLDPVVRLCPKKNIIKCFSLSFVHLPMEKTMWKCTNTCTDWQTWTCGDAHLPF